MNDVADAAGVTKPVLYQHFDSKQDLYLALLDEVGRRLLTAIAKATAGATSGKTQTELGFKAYFRWVADDHDSFLLLFGTQANRDAASTAAIRRMTAETADAIAPLIAVDIDPEYQRTARARPRRPRRGRQPAARRARRVVRPGRRSAALVANLAWAGLRAIGPSATEPRLADHHD